MFGKNILLFSVILLITMGVFSAGNNAPYLIGMGVAQGSNDVSNDTSSDSAVAQNGDSQTGNPQALLMICLIAQY